MWNPKVQGVGPTDGMVQFSGGLHPSFTGQNQMSDAVQQAIAAIGGILKQRQQDQIANQLLAVDNAKPAVAVDGTQKGTGTPDTALTQAMVQHNLGATYGGEQPGGFSSEPGKTPDLGGWQGLQMADFMHKRMADRLKEQQAAEDRPLDLEYRRAQIAHLLNGGSGGGDPRVWTSPSGEQYAVGPSGGLHKLGGGDISPAGEAAANRAATKSIRQDLTDEFGIPPTGFSHVTPGRFDEKGNWIADQAGDQAMIGNPITTHVPASSFFGMMKKPAADVPESYRNVFPREAAERGAKDAADYIRMSHSGGLPQQQSGSAPEGGKSLDSATAQQFLQQAGGDKEKARQLARAAGYTF